MQKIGEVLNIPVIEDDDHLLVFGNALGHRSYVGPQPVARLSWGVTNHSHRYVLVMGVS
jgi:hypothetical protein